MITQITWMTVMIGDLGAAVVLNSEKSSEILSLDKTRIMVSPVVAAVVIPTLKKDEEVKADLPLFEAQSVVFVSIKCPAYHLFLLISFSFHFSFPFYFHFSLCQHQIHIITFYFHFYLSHFTSTLTFIFHIALQL